MSRVSETVLWLLLLMGMLLSVQCSGQSPDEMETYIPEDGIEPAEPGTSENLAEDLESEALAELSLRPVNINSEEISDLLSHGLISEDQFQALTEYRYRYGAMVSLYELLYVDGWDEASVRRIMPFTRIGKLEAGSPKLRNVLKRCGQTVVITAESALQKSKGYLSDDTTGVPPHYAGSPARMALRYDLEYPGKIRVGIRAEKDAGEKILVPVNHESTFRIPDHLSGFIHARDIGFAKNICLGDYAVSFGQGLLAGSAAMRSGSLTGLIRSFDGIKPHSSINERYYYRGAGLTAGIGKLALTCFYSRRKLDPTGIVYDSTGITAESFSSINTTGFHRTASELASKNLLSEILTGAFAVFRGKWIKFGMGAMVPEYGLPQTARNEPYARFSILEGKQWLASGEFQLLLRRIHLAAECAFGEAMPPAWIIKAIAVPSDGLKTGLALWQFPAGFFNPFGTGFISGPANRNESGFWMGWEAVLPFRTSVGLQANLVRHDWISYGSDAPAFSQAISARMTNKWFQSLSLLVTISYRRVTGTYHDEYQYTEKEKTGEKLNFRVQSGFRLNEQIEARTAVYYTHYRSGTGGCSEGSGVSVDLNYRPAGWPLRIWIRSCVFGTDSFDSRISMYESGPLYEFGSVNVYGNGWRTAIMLIWSPLSWLELRIKAGQSTYPGQDTIGSGWEEIKGQRKTVAEVQARIRW